MIFKNLKILSMEFELMEAQMKLKTYVEDLSEL
jgi:hypothetical protein